MHILRYSGEGNDVLSANDMWTAIQSNGGVKGVVACVVDVGFQSSRPKTKIANISTLNNFDFCSNGVIVRRAYKVGRGHLIPNAQLKDNIFAEFMKVIIPFPCFEPHRQGNMYLQVKNPSNESTGNCDDACVDNENNQHQDEDSGENCLSDGLYACPEQSCTKVFTKCHLLEAHICRGNHAFPRNENSYDKVKLLWGEQCMAVDRGHKLPIQSTSSINLDVNEGWALKLTKPSKRFTRNVKDYLYNIYLECNESGKRPNFEQLSNELKLSRNEDGTKIFTREEWLSPSQIRNLFANFVRLGTTPAAKGDQDEDLQNVVRDLETPEFQSNISQLVTDIVYTFQ